MTERGYSFRTIAEYEILHDVKERLSQIAADYNTEKKDAANIVYKKKTYELPDGNIITFGSDRFHFSEVLFQPSFIYKEAGGFHDTSFQPIMKS